MTPVSKAIWYIESHLNDVITLETIANVADVSRHHLVRAFGVVTGISVMRYLRMRRLSVAAQALAVGAPNILDVALEAGYNSHEAFTRAFREQFGHTPEAVREQGHLDNLSLTEPLKMSEQTHKDLPAPRIVQSKPKRIAGLVERYDEATVTQIPSQWGRFNATFAPFAGMVNDHGYGVVYDGKEDGTYNYMAGVEVTETADLPNDYHVMQLSSRQYIVFKHVGHVSSIQETWATIWNKAIPESNYEVTTDPTFEVYGENFDPQTGNGGVDIWIPVDNKS